MPYQTSQTYETITTGYIVVPDSHKPKPNQEIYPDQNIPFPTKNITKKASSDYVCIFDTRTFPDEMWDDADTKVWAVQYRLCSYINCINDTKCIKNRESYKTGKLTTDDYTEIARFKSILKLRDTYNIDAYYSSVEITKELKLHNSYLDDADDAIRFCYAFKGKLTILQEMNRDKHNKRLNYPKQSQEQIRENPKRSNAGVTTNNYNTTTKPDSPRPKKDFMSTFNNYCNVGKVIKLHFLEIKDGFLIGLILGLILGILVGVACSKLYFTSQVLTAVVILLLILEIIVIWYVFIHKKDNK